MSKKDKVVKPVSFNPNKEEEAELLKHVKRRNFSGYVKKLIKADLQQRKELKSQQEPNERHIEEVAEVDKQTAAQRLQSMQDKFNRQ